MSTTRSCDSCKSAKAVLYCLADLAFLCMNCDSKIHTTRQHERVWLCDLCEEAPASVTCKADAAMLCVTCDRNIHSANPLAVRHERVPVVPFLEAQPASSWMIPSFNLPNFFEEKKEKEKEKSEGDYVYSDMDPYFDLDNVPSMKQSFHTQQKKVFGSDGVVPDTNPSPPAPIVSSPSPFYIDFGGSKPEPPYTFSVQSAQSAQSLYSVSSSSDLVVPDRIDIAIGNGAVAVTSVEATPLSGLEREARVLRYREKRKNRKFEKTIRYASRKAYAETRPRIKGRFVKRTEREMGMEREVKVVDGMYSSAFAFMAHSVGYGVVPTF